MIYNIYVIYNNVDDNVYVGSTTRNINQRFSEHRYKYREYMNNRHMKHVNYYASFELFIRHGVDNCFIKLVNSIECSNSYYATIEENKVINEYGVNAVNQQRGINIRTIRKYERLERRRKLLNRLIAHAYPFQIIAI